ncbi:hypothetical protein, partial [Larkinella humicola]|uniref:hypothetical protein n=1 Tax=Larkinella humicola TaxID=2607654 RepID=UPI001CD9D8E9
KKVRGEVAIKCQRRRTFVNSVNANKVGMFYKYTHLLSEDTKPNWYAGLRYQMGPPHRRTVVARPKMKIGVLISLFWLHLPLMVPENS